MHSTSSPCLRNSVAAVRAPDGVTLVPFGSSHFPLLKSWFASERDVILWAGPHVRFPLDDTQLAWMLAEGVGDRPARTCWMAERGGALIGHAQLAFDWRNGNATLTGFVIAPAARGRGFASAMLACVVYEAFARPEIERLELNVYTFNTRAISTYERAGFQSEGVRRASTRVNGERWDTGIMALLRSERRA